MNNAKLVRIKDRHPLAIPGGSYAIRTIQQAKFRNDWLRLPKHCSIKYVTLYKYVTLQRNNYCHPFNTWSLSRHHGWGRNLSYTGKLHIRSGYATECSGRIRHAIRHYAFHPWMFGDDLFTATARTKSNTDKLLAYSIESVYLPIGYPGPSKSLLYHQQWRGTKWWIDQWDPCESA